MKVKICGLREKENVEALAPLKPDFMGFIFYEKSPRHFPDAKEPADIKSIPKEIKKVGVFVNQSSEYVATVYAENKLDYVQLHGSESPQQCADLSSRGIQVIKAFSVKEEADLLAAEKYSDVVFAFLFDTKGEQKGGNGVRFDWRILQNQRFVKPFMLSGGIGPEHSEELKRFIHPDLFAIDINSRFEISPGIKNIESIESFLSQLS